MPDPSATHAPSPPVARLAVIGTGTVGASWAALFHAHGFEVVAHDPAPDAAARLDAFIADAWPLLQRLGAPGGGRLSHAATPEEAAATADFVQENAPETLALKQSLLRRLDAAAPAHAIIASSTSSLLRSRMVETCAHPDRIIIAHPFNPPHIVPLVELLGSDAGVVARAAAFYAAVGKTPVILQREAVGHIANRLTAALLREALYMVEQGIADVEGIDTALRCGPGLRWALMGPFLTYHLGGGEGGIRHYLEHLGPSQVERWKDLGTPTLDAALMERVARGVEEAYGGLDLKAFARRRDESLCSILDVQRTR